MPEAARLGIGIITRNRVATLQRCAAEIARHTREPYVLVVADDGSTDATVAWARGAGIAVVAGPRRGCAWNKNRALAYLRTRTACDAIVLFEDDTWPITTGWDTVWIAAARRWHHVNYCYGYEPEGAGTPEDPYQGTAFGGHCTMTTRAALDDVGYLDSRFVGYGCEHIEWTHRFRGRYEQAWALPQYTVPCLDYGVLASWPASSFSNAEMESNKAVWARIRENPAEPVPRAPWRTDAERSQLQAELDEACAARAGARARPRAPAT